MKRLFLIEPVIGIYAFASFLVYPLVQQYVYRRLWKDITNTTYPISDNSSRCALTNISSNHTNQNEEVQRQASLFSLYTELFSIIPSLTVTLLLVAYSDKRGRKMTIVLPLIGSLIYTLSFLALSYFELNVYLLIGASLVSSLFGGLGTFLGGCFAYVADLCEDGQKRTLRMAGVDMVIGLVSGVASLSSGYFLRAAGFNWPFFTGAILQCVSLLYAVFILEETVKKTEDDAAANGHPRRSGLKQMLYGIYHLYAGATCRRNVIIVLILLIFATFSFAYVGGLSMITLYELKAPLCWSEILIGYGSALSTSVFLTSFLGVSAFMYCGMPPLLIVLIGILSVMAGMTLLAFANTTALMFLVRVPMLLAIMPFPVLRGMMSKIVSKTEQGALFACVAFVDSLSSNIAYTVFTTIYAATVSWYPGFSFLLSAGLCSVPILLLGVVCVLGIDINSKEENKDPETERLLSGEDQVHSEHQNDNNAPVSC